jgi:hypothetical protein
VVIKDFRGAVAHLRSRFCTETWQQDHGLDSKFTINRVSIVEAHSHEIDRRAEELYEPVVGIRKSFGYMALSKERVLQRWFDCWCPECMHAEGVGKGTMDSNYQVCGCRSKEPWWEHSVALLGTRGIGAQKKEAQRRGRDLASRLKLGTFIAVEDRKAPPGTVAFLIGITLDSGNGTCIKEHVKGPRKTIAKTRFDDGDYAIQVQWYHFS